MLFRNKKANDYHMGKWNGLGGKLESGETPEECAIREVKEESGLIADHLIFKGFITFPMFDGIKDWHVFIFVIDKWSGELIDSPEGKLEWINNDKLNDLSLWDGDKIFLKWLNRQGFFSAKFNYKSGKLISHEVVFYDGFN
jgi:8-oxo-dGTP diphosphatase